MFPQPVQYDASRQEAKANDCFSTRVQSVCFVTPDEFPAVLFEGQEHEGTCS